MRCNFAICSGFFSWVLVVPIFRESVLNIINSVFFLNLLVLFYWPFALVFYPILAPSLWRLFAQTASVLHLAWAGYSRSRFAEERPPPGSDDWVWPWSFPSCCGSDDPQVYSESDARYERRECTKTDTPQSAVSCGGKSGQAQIGSHVSSRKSRSFPNHRDHLGL